MSPSNRTCRSPAIIGSAAVWWTIIFIGMASRSVPVPAAPVPQPPETSVPANVQEADAGKSGKSALMWRTATGELVPMDQLGFSQNVLEELLQRMQLQNQVPLFNISDLELRGRVDQDVLHLRVDLSVTVLPGQEWVRVPIGFGELQVSGLPTSAEMSAGQAIFDTDATNQKQWSLYGKGMHQLSVELIGQVRNTANGRPRIRFTSPKAARSHLLLTLDADVDNVTGNGNLPPHVTHDDGPLQTTIELWGMSGETELTWEPRPEASTERLLVQAPVPAQMTLDLRTVPASLSCRQPIEITGGSLDSLTVRLPSFFRAVSITGESADGSSVVRPFDRSDLSGSEGRNVVIQFSEPVREVVTLKYDLELSEMAFPQTMALSVPDIEQVRNESGNVEILIPQGLLVEPDTTTMTQARRKRVETLTDTKTAATAYQLLSAEARIDLRVSEIEPLFAVDPQIEIATEDNNNNVVLAVRFSFNVIRGSLNETSVLWKNFSADGWQIWPGSTVLISDRTTPLPVSVSDENPDQIQLAFPDRQSGQFVIELRAFRNLDSFLVDDAADAGDSQPDNRQAASDTFFLPDLVASTRHATTVTLVESDEWSVELTKPDGRADFPTVPISPRARVSASQTEPATARLVEKSGSAVRLRLTSQQPEVRTSAVVDLRQGPDGGSIHVHEELQFEIRHRDLDEIRLNIPNNVIPKVRLHGQPETLTPSTTLSGQTVFPLPTPKRGELLIDVDYQWAPPPGTAASQDQTVDVPLVLSAIAVQRFTVGTDLLNLFQLETTTQLRPVYSNRFAAAWQAGTAETTIPVTLLRPLGPPPPAVPQLTIYRTVIGKDVATTLASVIYDSYPSTVVFSVPASCDVKYVSVNGEPAELVAIRRNMSTPTGDMPIPAEAQPEPDDVSMWRVAMPFAGPGEDTASATVVAIRIRQALSDRSGLVSTVHPLLPAVAEVVGASGRIWLISSDAGEMLIRHGNESDWFRASEFLTVPGLTTQSEVTELLSPMLAAYESPLRKAARTQIDDGAVPFGTTAVLVDGAGNSAGFLLITTRAVLLGLSVFAVVSFAVLVRLQQIQVITLFVTTAAFATAVFALIPTDYTSLYLLAIIGTMVGGIAALIQRLLATRSTGSVAWTGPADQSTIFAAERTAWQPGSSASVSRTDLVGAASGATSSEVHL